MSPERSPADATGNHNFKEQWAKRRQARCWTDSQHREATRAMVDREISLCGSLLRKSLCEDCDEGLPSVHTPQPALAAIIWSKHASRRTLSDRPAMITWKTRKFQICLRMEFLMRVLCRAIMAESQSQPPPSQPWAPSAFDPKLCEILDTCDICCYCTHSWPSQG